MLNSLAIKNFAVIDDIRIRFKEGLSVLTGETGAGKSIIIEAVNLLLGARASADLVRTGADSAELEAFFDINEASGAARILEDQGMDSSDGLIIRRVVAASGKSRVFINSRQSTLDLLRQVSENLAGISSQHAHQGLLKEENHLGILDEYAGTWQLRQEVEGLYHQILPLADKIAELNARRTDMEKESDLLRFQVEEIEAAAIKADEDETLAQEQAKLAKAGRIFEAANRAVHLLHDRENSLVEQVAGLKQDLETYAGTDPDLEDFSKRLDSAVFDLQDVAHGLRRYADTIDLDPASLEAVNIRIDEIAKLKRKYGGSLEALFSRYEQMTQDLKNTRDLGNQIEDLTAQKEALTQKIRTKTKALSMRRQKAGVALSKLAMKELAALEMGKSQFITAFSTKDSKSSSDIQTDSGEKIFSTGMDRVGFLFSANPGEVPRPLAKIASGGELSRIVLALKAVLSDSRSFETLIFDEVDAGIGGATSEKVGLKLKDLAKNHQVICITHLAQIAKYGNHQFRIVKQVEKGRTHTTILPLESKKERIREVARMIGGRDITPATLAHAKELIDQVEVASDRT